MLFNSLDFLFFFIVVYALYLVLPHRGQNVLLLIASYFFYGCWDYRFLTLIWFSTIVDFWIGQRIHSAQTTRGKKLFLLVSLCTNLGFLGFFKYFNFFVDSALALLAAVGVYAEPRHLNIILPVGISFYTFQAMSYTIDIYRGQLKPTARFLDFALFVAYFPQLVAGPIERATHLVPQMERPRVVTWDGVQTGAWLIFWGLFKKAVIADNMAVIADRVFDGAVPLAFGSVLLGVYAFAIQIYCDFSGYSDMARGLARMMGFDIMVNFNNPYFALNPSDFWRRWHISLSTWLRDYLYIPLGGNRKGPRRTYVNLALTMLLGGLWHGAAWTFVLWGAYHGLLLMIHRFFSGGERAPPKLSAWGRGWRMVLMFHAVCGSWLLFRAQSVGQVADMLKGLTVPVAGTPDIVNGFLAMILLALPLWIVQILQESRGTLDAPLRLSLLPRTVLYVVVLIMLVSLGNTGGHAFIYFQF